MPDDLRAAVLACTADADLARNAACIRAGLDTAAGAGATLLLTPECALCGYPGGGRSDLDQLDAARLAGLEADLAAHARRLGLTLVLGTASRAAAPVPGLPPWTNDAVVLGGGDPGLRYRKRCLTPLDARHFQPGDERQPVPILNHAGWRLGLSICFELRFGDCWAAQALAGADAFLSLAHMAGEDADPPTKRRILPALYSARAAEWATPLLLASTAAADRWLESGSWDARGVPGPSCAAGVLVVSLRHRSRFDPWYAHLHASALRRAALAGAVAAAPR
jgi:predicted amidohydrolase